MTDEQRRVLKQALWDLNLTPEEFLSIIKGKSDRKWPERGFCAARLLENVNWFDIVKIIKPKEICRFWSDAQKYVRISSIREGMGFASRILR